MLLAVWADSVFVLTCDLVDFVTYLGLQSSLVSCVLRLWGVGLCALCGFLGFGLVVVCQLLGFVIVSSRWFWCSPVLNLVCRYRFLVLCCFRWWFVFWGWWAW